jgi:hypothetical protein
MNKPIIINRVGLTSEEMDRLDQFEDLDELNDDIFEDSPLFDEYGDLNEDWERIIEEGDDYE